MLLNMMKRIPVSKSFNCDRMSAAFVLSGALDRRSDAIMLDQGQYRENKTPMTWASVAMLPQLRLEESASHLAAVSSCIDRDDERAFHRLVGFAWEMQQRRARRSIGASEDDMNFNYARIMARKLPHKFSGSPE